MKPDTHKPPRRCRLCAQPEDRQHKLVAHPDGIGPVCADWERDWGSCGMRRGHPSLVKPETDRQRMERETTEALRRMGVKG